MIINFPYYKFKQYENVNFASYDDIKRYVYTEKEVFYKKPLAEFIENFESLYLFEGLMLIVLKLAFDPDYELITENQLQSKSKLKSVTI